MAAAAGRRNPFFGCANNRGVFGMTYQILLHQEYVFRARRSRLLLPARGEKVGMRGLSARLRIAETAHLSPLSPAPPPHARGEKVGMRGLSARLRIAETPPHPRSLRSLDLSPRGGER